MTAKIIPAILASDFEEFKKCLAKLEGISDLIQIDVMDGDFVENESFLEIEEIIDLKTKANFELHLMVQDPLVEMKKWTHVKNIKGVIFHIESVSNMWECIDFARSNKWKVGIAVNPESPLFIVEKYYPIIDEILFLTVFPGRQGAPFVPEVKNKIKEFIALENRPICAVDGGVTAENIGELKQMGVEVFCIGSALLLAPDVKKAYDQLLTI